jgi:uncharacterized protein (TIGR03437 family)
MTRSNLRHAGLMATTVVFLPVLLCPAATNYPNYGNLPLSFERNAGQVDAKVHFLARSPSVTVFLTDSEAVLALSREDGASAAVAMELLGARKPKEVAGIDKLPGAMNYLHGNDPKQWRTGVPTFAKVRYRQLYPGIDLIYYGNQGRLEYDFAVAPGADPKTIQLGFRGAAAVKLDADGGLVIATGTGELRFEKPYVYQEVMGRRRSIEARYVLLANQRAGFSVAEYDRSLPLVIDPVLVYLGTLAAGNGRGIAIDSTGNAYITGYTSSLNFPIVGGLTGSNPMSVNAAEVFVTKVNPAGTAIVYSTLFGGSGADQGIGIAVDNTGAAYIAGSTTSLNFPVVNPAQAAYGGNTDAFVAKLNDSGTALVYSTYLGGSNADSAAGIAVDKTSGRAFVTGVTNSNNFPTQTPYQAAVKGGRDAFITKLDPAGALVFSTYLGGTGEDYGQSVAIDESTNVYVTGYTSSTNFPITTGVVQNSLKGGFNAFVTKLSGSGTALAYSTYLGGTCSDYGYGIAVHSSGSAYVTGETCSWDFPITAGVVQPQKNMGSSAFVTKLKPDGTSLLYSTFLTSNRQARATAIAVDEPGWAYVTGFNYGEDFPTFNALQEAREWYVPIMVCSINGGVDWDSIQSGMSGSAVPAISIDPRNTATIVVAESGINRTTDGGHNWTHTNLWNTASSIARSASNPDILYTATGNGIYKSTDNGQTWSRLGANPAGAVNLLAVHPTDPANLTAATTSGIFQSSDGINWTSKNTGLLNFIVNDWDRSPADPKVQYAATAGGVYKTVDNAATWSLVGAGLPLPVNTNAFRLAVNPADANTIYLLLGNGTFYRSTDAGANWNLIGSGIRGSVLLFALAPSNPSIVYAATSRAVYRSRDGGITWTQVYSAGQIFGLLAIEVDPKNADLVYVGLSVQSDVFVSKINQLGTAFAYSTLLGGQANDSGMGIAADSSGNAYVSGTGNSPFPTTAGSFSQIIGGAFIAKIADTKAPCTYVVRPGDAANEVSLFYSAGGEGRFFVIAPSGCDWAVNSGVPWITVPGGNNGGTGVGPVWIDVDANTGPARQGTVTIGGQERVVRQAGGACTYTRAVEALAVPAAGGTFSVPLTTTADCDWAATANQGWFAATPGSGSGSGTVTITVQANPGASARVGSVFIGGNGVLISQVGVTATFTFDPAAVNVPADASTGNVAVTTNLTTANWRAVSTQSWLTVTSGPNFTGSVTVNYAVQANTGAAARTAQILAGATVFTVTQAGLGTTTPLITSVNAAGGGPDIALNTWVEIKGANLAPADLGPNGFTWSTAPEFASGKMPTQLRNVSVTVNGKPSYVYFISSMQVNVLTGLDSTTGQVRVVVSNSGNSSLPFTVNVRTGAPGFFLLGATKYIASTHGNGSLLGPASMSVPGYEFTPAKPNETVVLYANGYGLPSTPLVEGSSTQFSPLPSPPVILIGGIQATAAYAGVVAPGLYQFNVVVPANAPDGDNSVTATYAGFTTAPGALVTIQR